MIKFSRKPFFVNSKSITHKWIKHFLIVLIFPILLNYIAYTISIYNLEKDVIKRNFSFYEAAQKNVDFQLLSFQKIGANLGIVDEVRNNVNPSIGYAQEKLQQSLLLYDVELKDSYRNFVYYKTYGKMVNSSRVFSDWEYFQKELPFLQLDYLTMKTWLDRPHNSNYLFVSGKRDTVKENKHYIMWKMPIGFPVAHAYFVVVLEDNFFYSLSDNETSENIGFLVLSKEGTVIAASKVMPMLNEQDFWHIDSSSGTFKADIDGESNMVCYIKSPINGWNYVFTTPQSVYLRSVNAVKYTQWVIIVLALVLGCWILAASVRRLYVPIRKLLNIVPDQLDKFGSYDEYGQIEQILKHTAQMNDQMENVFGKQQKILINDHLAKLMKGNLTTVDGIIEESVESLFPHNQFLVSIFFLNDYKLLFLDETDLSDTERYSLMHMIASNIFSESLERAGCKSHFIDIDQSLVCIINFDRMVEEQTIFDALKFAKDNIEEYFYVSTGAAISNQKKGIGGLNKGFQEALSVFEYILITEEPDIIFFQDVSGNEGNFPHVSVQNLEGLLKAIRNGDFKSAEQLLTDFIGQYTADENFSPVTLRYAIYESAIEIIKNFGGYIQDEEYINNIFKSKIPSAPNINALVHHICENIQRDMKSTELTTNKKVALTQEMVQYMEENYTDVDLNIAKLSDHFGYVPSYLSKIFKEGEGIAILDFLNRKRVDKAKQLLLESNWLLKEIAEYSGFYSAASLIRVFKKYEGVTPGNYKNFVIGKDGASQ